MGWSRPPGPPRVWRDIELVNHDGKEILLSIQEIPENRYEEILEHMCTTFVTDEATLSSMKTVEDPEALEVLKDFWGMALKQGISIMALDKSTNGEEPILAGVNILTIVDEEFENKLKSYVISHVKMRKFLDFVLSFSAEKDPRQIFMVDSYLSAFGLSVDPKYRCLGLGKQLLETRNNIGRVYNVSVTETMFTSAISQKIAAAVGFQDILVRNYDDIIDQNDPPHVKMGKYFNFIFDFFAEADPRKTLGVDLYLSEFGLYIHPEYSGLRLGKHLLDTRNDVASAYNMTFSEAIYSTVISQDYDDIVDENGAKLFPSLAGKQIKSMTKQFSHKKC